MPSLEAIQEAFYADLLSVPYHRRVGISVQRGSEPDSPRVALPAGPGLAGPGGEISPAALFLLADAAAAVQMAGEVAPRALQVRLGAIFLTTTSRFRQLGPARGTVEASTELVRGLDEEAGRSRPARRAPVDVSVRLTDGAGVAVASHETSFQVRFMEPSRLRAMLGGSSEVLALIDS
jgi:acyl-coenzyme A thioesterase PaaI-like protein